MERRAVGLLFHIWGRISSNELGLSNVQNLEHGPGDQSAMNGRVLLARLPINPKPRANN